MPISELTAITENTLPTRTNQVIGSSIPNPYIEGASGNLGEDDKNVYPDYLPPVGKTNLPITATSKELFDARKFGVFDPSKTENEFAYGQSFGEKMVSGVGKGLLLTGTTLLQTTVGALNGLVQWGVTGKASSFYNNDLNKWVDDINAEAENRLPNLYSDVEKNADWYSPKYLFTGNFLWDGIVKNLGFAGGAALSGMGFASVLRAIPLTSRLFSVGKAAEALAATERGLLNADKVIGTYGEIKSLFDKFLTSYKLLNKGGRALVAGLSTSGEASVEAYQNMNQFRNQKIEEYKQLHEGKEPMGIDLETINRDSESVGNSSYLANAALLSVTNFIQFPKILGSSYTAEKGMLNSLTRETGDIIETGGKYVAKPTGNRVLSTLNRSRKYTFSAPESFEEGSQFAIQMGTQDYYDKQYNNVDNNIIESFKEGISQTLNTNEGMKNTLIGGVSGAIMMGRGRWKQNSRKEQNTGEALRTGKWKDQGLNSARLSDFMRDTEASVNRGIVLQQEREELLTEGNLSASKDVEADYVINYLAPRIKYGRFDLVMSEINDYRTLASTEEGWNQLQQEGKALKEDTREKYSQRLNGLEETANNVKSLYQSLYLRYGSQVDPETKKLVYSSAVMDKMVYAVSKVADYDKRIPSLLLNLSSTGVDINTILQEISTGNFDGYKEALAILQSSQEVNKDDVIQSFEDVARLTILRNQFLKEYNDIKENPKKHQEIKIEEAKLNEEGNTVSKETVKIQTKNINDEFEIGIEYFLGRIVEYDKAGHEIYREPIITIIGENEDGTIRIKASNGRIRDISKEDLADYKLGKVSETLSNKKAKFFLEHQNTVYEFNFGKGKKQKGRLQYSPKEGVLLFTYKNSKGKVVSLDVKSSQFIAKKGYAEPMIKAIGELTATQKIALKEFEAVENKLAPEEVKIYEINKKEGRRQIVSDLFEELNNRFKKTSKLIEQRKTDVNLISQDITVLEKKIEEAKIPGRDTNKGFRFRPTIRKFIEDANRLSRAKEELEKEIELLETENFETENILAYLEDASQNIEELPVDSKELLYELGYEVEVLKDIVQETTKQIGGLSRVLDKVEKSLDAAMEFLHSLITDFTKLYPKVPTLIGQEWIDFLKLNPNFTKLKPTYKEDLRELDKIIAEVEDFDISPNEEKISNLKSELKLLENTLQESINELAAKQALLDKFQKAYDTYKGQKIEENLLKNNAALIKQVLGTATKDNTFTANTQEAYEALKKKAVKFIWRATMGVDRGKPHQIRANKFGANLEKFENRKNIRGVYVTSKNEKELGLEGLMDHLRTTDNVINEEIDRDDIIALVMVVLTESGSILIGENGQPISETDKINSAIYQVLPAKELKWSKEYGGGSMFRENTPQEVIDFVTEEYARIRKDILENETLDAIHEIGASFGFPLYKEQIDENGNVILKDGKPLIDYSVRNSVQDVGLVEDDDFYGKELILIPKVTSVADQGTTTYTNAKGKPFLQLPNAILPLQNRKHTPEEAKNIFQAIKLYAQYMMNTEIGLKNKKTEQLYNWLQSVIYWGIPETQEGVRKPEAYNSIFWEKTPEGEFMLKISGKGKEYLFNPINLEENKTEILTILEAMYNNINSSMALKVFEAYEEILSISEKGDVVSRIWLNYQAYLLANKFMAFDEKDVNNGKARKDLPLSTIMIPSKENDVNRTGIYFYTDDNAGDVDISQIKINKPVVIPITKPVKTPENTGEYILDGKTPNTYTSPLKETITPEGKKVVSGGKKVVFRATPDGTITVLQEGDITEILKNAKERISDTDKKKNPLKEEQLTEEEIDKNAKIGIKAIIAKEIAHLVKEDDGSFIVPDEPMTNKPQEDNSESLTIDDTTLTSADIELKLESKRNALFSKKRKSDTNPRIKLREAVKDFVQEDWTKLEKWLKANFPNIPVYRVKNIIQATNGRQAWGMLQDGAIYVYENAEVGTIYHEVFEAVWKMFSSPEEQISIINEFKSRKGSFTDRPSGSTIKYSNATKEQIKEQLAEEFRDYVQFKKIPAKPDRGRPFIFRMFVELYTFIKEFFTGKKAQSNTELLFKNINEGFYKTIIPYETQLSLAKQGVIDIDEIVVTDDTDFRLVGINDKERSEIIEHMTYLTLRSMTDTDQNLFNIMNRKRSEVYGDLKKQILSTLYERIVEYEELIADGDLTTIEKKEAKKLIKEREQLINATLKQWEAIVKRHEEYLKGYQIEFDENDELQYKDEDKVRESDYVEANKVDSFKKTNSAVKLLLATVPEVDADGNWVESSIGGVKLVPISRTFISLMNNLHTSQSIEEMVYRLREMAENDPNYRGLYKRFTKKSWSDTIFKDGNNYGANFDEIETEHGLRLLSAIWKTFKKQNPEVKNVTVLETGEVVISSANLSTAAGQLQEDYTNDIIATAKEGKGYFIYDEKKKAYIGDKDKIKKVNVETSLPAMVGFLQKLGIVFDKKKVQELKGENLSKFKEAVQAIKLSIENGEEIVSFSRKVLNISGRLLQLGEVQASISNPEFDSTFFNINNERTQSFIGTNPASDLHDFLSQVEKLDLAHVGTNYRYLLTDSFAKGSVILKRMFSPKGIRNKGNEDLMQVVYISGTNNQIKGKQRQSSKLSYKERLVQELNLNISGYYMNLVPGDASMEWALRMGNAISRKDLASGLGKINMIFRDYFYSELELAKENRQTTMAKLRVDKKTGEPIYRDAKEMRFFKAILGEVLHKEIINDKESIDRIYAKNEKKINTALNLFITNQNTKLKQNLQNYGIINETETGYQFENVNIQEDLTEDALDTELTLLTINFMINSIELHKLIYSDPYQYADELKRVKNFNSPRQAIISNSSKMNLAFDRVWNKGFDKKDIGWTNFTQDFFKSITYQDVMGYIEDLPGYQELYKETDGGGMISFKSYRQFRIRATEWNDNEEKQYRYDVAFEKKAKNKDLTPQEVVLINEGNPGVRSAYTPIKPIVSGSKNNGNTYNDILLDKFALYPVSYRLLTALNEAGSKTASNAIQLYNKMQEENIDYVVFESSRKVGAVTPVSVYNAKGKFNTDIYSEESIINVPFSIMSIQTDVPSKDDGSVTRGSQITKLVTMDFMEAGVPIDFQLKNIIGKATFNGRYKAWYNLSEEQRLIESPLYKEIKTNQELLEEMIEVGYQSLLKQLGIVEKKGKYSISDFTEAGNTLRNEILKREVNDNISDALQSFIDGKSILEATPAYQQVRNILYSIADREVISQKISGGMKVLIPSATLESVRPGETVINSKKGFTSTVLKFYKKDGKQVCEIMVGRWFKSPLSDSELLDLWYEKNDDGTRSDVLTEEGKKILSGIAFRIPTQKQNSIESFVIKQFLPQEFGDSVVLPAAMVAKSGGDFDIDKLTMYFKNVFKNLEGNISLIEYKGTEKETKEFYDSFFSENIWKKIENLENKDDFREGLLSVLAALDEHAQISLISPKTYLSFEENKFYEKHFDLIYNIIDQAEEQGMKGSQLLQKQMDESGGQKADLFIKLLNESLRENYVNSMYKKALQNEYIQSSQNLVSHPLNFDRLIKPNSAEQMKALSKEIALKTIGQSFDYTEVGNMLDREFMSSLRHAFVSGKQGIGIAATNQTLHSLFQRFTAYIDTDKLKNVSDEDGKWLGDALITFDKYNKIEINGKPVATLSMIKNADGQDISDIIAQFIDGYVDISKGPWIMEMGATPNTASTWLFLVKLGVPIDTVAYFMNQPIIRDYLRTIETAGYSWLFMDSFVESTKKEYSSGRNVSLTQTTIPSKNLLKATVGKKSKDLNAEQKEQQQFILGEFLKYAKMANQLFLVTQGSNYDTASFNDPYLVFKKFEQLKKAQNTIISSVDDLVENSFIGKLGGSIVKLRDALATILKSDQKRVRGIMHKVLLPFVDERDREFVKIAQKAVSDLFDYAVQTDANFNIYIKDTLINDGGVGREVQTLMQEIKENPKHPLYSNYIVGEKGIMQYLPSKKSDGKGANNIKVKGLGNKIYDQNNIIYAFREIREHLKGKSKLYDRIVQLAILQSGLSHSNISFTSVIPQEDFEKIYSKTLSKLETLPNLENFHTLNVFQRNNWNNDDIVPHNKAKLITSKRTGDKFYNLPMSFKYQQQHIQNAITKNKIPQLLKQRQNEREANIDHMVYSWEKQEDLITPQWKAKYPNLYGWKLVKQIKSDMRKSGDFSYINKGLFEKVKDNSGNPLETSYKQKMEDGTEIIVKQFVYKAINAWGEGPRANEFYATSHKSVLDNGFIKVEEVDNNTIIDIFMGKNKNIPTQIEQQKTDNWEKEDNNCPVPF